MAKNYLTKTRTVSSNIMIKKLLLIIIKTKRVMYYIFSYSLVSTLFSLLTANDDDALSYIFSYSLVSTLFSLLTANDDDAFIFSYGEFSAH